jgi:hypothetical protein
MTSSPEDRTLAAFRCITYPTANLDVGCSIRSRRARKKTMSHLSVKSNSYKLHMLVRAYLFSLQLAWPFDACPLKCLGGSREVPQHKLAFNLRQSSICDPLWATTEVLWDHSFRSDASADIQEWLHERSWLSHGSKNEHCVCSDAPCTRLTSSPSLVETKLSSAIICCQAHKS